MAAFSAPCTFDLAACMLCSASYLLSDDAVRSHFASVRRALAADGLYVLELMHPSELSGPSKTQSVWQTQDERGALDVAWLGDAAGAVDGIWQADVKLVYRPFDGGSPVTVEGHDRQRGFGYAELVRLARESGLEPAGAFGGFDETVARERAGAANARTVQRERCALEPFA
jgi:hypothetical protein